MLKFGKNIYICKNFFYPIITKNNMKNRFSYLLLSGLLLTACGGGQDFQQTDKGVVIKVKNAKGDTPSLVRLEVMGDKIIRVSATKDAQFKDPQSLIIVDVKNRPQFKVEEKGDTVSVVTSAIKGNVLKSTGEVFFTDLNGNTILHEQNGGGKQMTPYSVTQTHANGQPETYKGWSYQQVFESPDDEAFYGLGQHQADDWNYKGKNEELYQYNTKVSIPFVVSSNNYGVLFDSYSLMRFGNPKPYSILKDIFNLYDKDGKEGALTGTYNIEGQAPIVRREDSIYVEDFKTAGRVLPKGLDKATVVIEGQIEPKQSGEYKFLHYYSGYQKIYLDGKSVYTEDVAGKGNEQTIWRTAWNPNARKFSANLEKGKKYDIKIEWTPDGGEAYCGLRALEPVDQATQNKLSFWSEMTQQLDYYFIDGENADEVIAGYRALTGKAQIMPEWLLGYWQSRERYHTQDEIVTALKGFRDRKLPIDNIVMDWNYWTIDQWGSYDFDPERFSDPAKMISDIHDMNGKIMISCWPKFYPNVEHFKELNDKGFIYQQSLKDSLRDWLYNPIKNEWGFHYAFYDAYSPEARKIFWRQLYDKLGSIGMDAWWMDASEPNVRDCTPMEYRKLLCGPTELGSSDEYFNAYSIVNAEAIYDGQRGYETAIEKQGIDKKDAKKLQEVAKWNDNGFGNEANFSPNNNRVFLLTRSGFPAEQRYSTATWSGDIGTRWEDLKAQITAGLNFSISGIPFWSQDIGGFSVEKRYQEAQNEFDKTKKVNEDLKDWRELNVRWHQVGAFAPMYRSHGQFPYREPWNIAPENDPTYKAIKYYLDLRYRLMPYIYTMAAKIHFDDYTMMRPMVMDFGSDKAVRDIAYQFMFGPSIMVNPVYKYGAREREVYFPKDEVWYDFYTGQVASNGGETKTVPAPYEQIPLFVRGGSIIPFGPAIEYTREKAAENIRLYVYAGKNGEFTLYEDEGTNYGYEAGRYANIKFSYNDAAKTLTIADRQGEFPGMLKERTFTVVLVSADKPAAYNPDAKGIEVKYDGKAQEIKL